MTEKKLNDTYKTNYHFITKGKRTSFVLDELKDNFNEFEYKYDSLDNITDIYKNGDLINHYEYDNSNQLIKDDDYESGITTIYNYDNVGNIISKKDYRLQTERLLHEDVYEYNNTNWEDQLTKFNNENITYDEIGNPLTIGNKALTWTNGRQLKSIVDGDDTITYEYNKDGIRTKKTVNGQDTTYLLENNNIIFEESPKGMIYYKRDENNHLVGFRYNNQNYYYLKNAQEDIIGIMDSNYQIIANYKYDAYGNINLVADNNGLEITNLSHVAYINPFRYRSYYYDEETKLYYLNSRYYNPEFGRFINSDNLLGNTEKSECNLYCYCNNNPIIYKDSNGNFATEAGIGLGVGIGIIFFPQIYDVTKNAISATMDLISGAVEGVTSWARDVVQTGKKPNKMLEEQKHSVYTLYNREEKRVEYVGRSVNPERRYNQHRYTDPAKAKLELVVENRDRDLSYTEARIREEELIMYYGTLNRLNKRHGISPNSNLYKFVNLDNGMYFDSETYVGG